MSKVNYNQCIVRADALYAAFYDAKSNNLSQPRETYFNIYAGYEPNKLCYGERNTRNFVDSMKKAILMAGKVADPSGPYASVFHLWQNVYRDVEENKAYVNLLDEIDKKYYEMNGGSAKKRPPPRRSTRRRSTRRRSNRRNRRRTARK